MNSEEAKNIRNTIIILAIVIGGAYYFSNPQPKNSINAVENTDAGNSLTSSPTAVTAGSKLEAQPATTSENIETNSSCKLKAEGILNSSWIRTCYLRDSLTVQCKALFDADGYHKNFPVVGDPNWSDKFGQIISDTIACECQLPSDVVTSLKNTQQISNSLCDKYYPE